jgi:hypothetical protein
MSGVVHTVEVVLENVGGQGTVTSLDGRTSHLERHKVQVHLGDTVVWKFDNKYGKDVTVEIGKFRVDEEIVKRLIGLAPKIETEDRDDDPFSGPSNVLVQRAGGELRRTIRLDAHAPRTYKYDLIESGPGGKRVLLDPEIEIYR